MPSICPSVSPVALHWPLLDQWCPRWREENLLLKTPRVYLFWMAWLVSVDDLDTSLDDSLLVRAA